MVTTLRFRLRCWKSHPATAMPKSPQSRQNSSSRLARSPVRNLNSRSARRRTHTSRNNSHQRAPGETATAEPFRQQLTFPSLSRSSPAVKLPKCYPKNQLAALRAIGFEIRTHAGGARNKMSCVQLPRGQRGSREAGQRLGGVAAFPASRRAGCRSARARAPRLRRHPRGASAQPLRAE